MRFLTLPVADHEFIYNRCVAATEPESSRDVLAGASAQVFDACQGYLEHATARLHEVVPQHWSDNQKLLLEALYSDQLVAAKGTERNLYNLIRTSATRCPYCTFGEIYEVDHFLPKRRFPEFAVLPVNLLPICHPCNHTKRSKHPLNSTTYLLHPYYDQLPAITWLFAEMVFEAGGPVLIYRVDIDLDFYGDIAARLNYHFDTLHLGKRFKASSAAVLAEIEDVLTEHLGALSPIEISMHFASEADRKYRIHGNCIEAAAFRAASKNSDYCSGAYRN